MKKLFTLITAMMLFVGGASLNAQTTTTVWESDNADGTLLEWSKANPTINDIDVQAGDILTVTVSKVDKTIDAYPQGTMCTSVGGDWEWIELLNVQLSDAGKFEYTITEDMLEKIASHKQIFFKGTAAYITKVELTTDADPNLLWSDELTFTAAWSENIEISAVKMAGIKVGDKIQVTTTPSADNQLLFKNLNWQNMAPAYKVVHAASTEKQTAILGVTPANIDKLKAGWRIQGINFIAHEVKIIPADGSEDYANAIVVCNVALTEACNAVSVFLGVTELPATAKYLQIEIEGTPAWSQICNKGWTAIELTTAHSGNLLNFEINDALKECLADEFVIQGVGFTVKKVSLSETATGINAIETAAPAQNDVIYNLAGQKVDAGYKGVVIKNGKKFFQK